MALLFVLDAVDKVLFTWVNNDWAHPSLDSFMVFLSSKWAFIPLYALIVFVYVRKFATRFWVPVLLTVTAFGLSDSLSSRVIKPLVKRHRPPFEETMNPPIAEVPVRLPDGKPGGQYGFVSSHASNMFAILGIATMLMGWLRWRKLLFYGIAAAVAYSRVYLGVHYPGDVFFGAWLGYGIARLLMWLSKNRGWLSVDNSSSVVPL